MDTIYVIGLVLLGVMLLGLAFVPFAKSKGWLNESVLHGADTSIDIVAAIIKAVDLKGIALDTTNTVLHIADIANDYVVELMEAPTAEDQIVLGEEIIYRVLGELRIIPTDAQKNLINIIVKEGIEVYNKLH